MSGIDLLYTDQHILKEGQKNLDRPQNVIWYGPAKPDNTLPQNVQNIRRIHEVYRESIENWRVERMLKNLDRDLPGRCAITITIYNGNDALESHT